MILLICTTWRTQDRIYIYIYTNTDKPRNDTWVASLKGITEFAGESWSIRWGINKENFKKGIKLHRSEEDQNTDKFGVLPYYILPGPDTTLVTLEIP